MGQAKQSCLCATTATTAAENAKNEGVEDKEGQGEDEGDKQDKGTKASHGRVDKGEEEMLHSIVDKSKEEKSWPCGQGQRGLQEQVGGGHKGTALQDLAHKHTTNKNRGGGYGM